MFLGSLLKGFVFVGFFLYVISIGQLVISPFNIWLLRFEVNVKYLIMYHEKLTSPYDCIYLLRNVSTTYCKTSSTGNIDLI